MKVSIEVSSSFKASHWHDKTLNETTHPHHFKYTVTLSGPLNEEGYIADFREVENTLKQIDALFDGKVLNDILPVPTAENLALVIYGHIQKAYPSLISKVVLKETEAYAVVCEGI